MKKFNQILEMINHYNILNDLINESIYNISDYELNYLEEMGLGNKLKKIRRQGRIVTNKLLYSNLKNLMKDVKNDNRYTRQIAKENIKKKLDPENSKEKLVNVLKVSSLSDLRNLTKQRSRMSRKSQIKLKNYIDSLDPKNKEDREKLRKIYHKFSKNNPKGIEYKNMPKPRNLRKIRSETESELKRKILTMTIGPTVLGGTGALYGTYLDKKNNEKD